MKAGNEVTSHWPGPINFSYQAHKKKLSPLAARTLAAWLYNDP